MHKHVSFMVRGLSPLLLHNGQIANPLNKYAKALKEISAKRKKTDADYEAMAEIEWMGGLYLDEHSRPILPGEAIEAAFLKAAKQIRMGEKAKAGIISDGMWPIIHAGPKDLEALSKDPRFRDTRRVRVGAASVMRTRPIFVPWSLEFEISYLPDLFNEKQVVDTVVTMGRVIGVGDYTPKYGRFAVESSKAVAHKAA